MSVIPNTFIIGFLKAGTTSLHETMALHPQIHTAQFLKDFHFFRQDNYSKYGIAYVEEHFSKSYQDQKIILDTGAGYIYEKFALNKILAYQPHAKFIICLRDPIGRMISEYKYNYKKGKRKINFQEILDSPPGKWESLLQVEFHNSQYSRYIPNIFDLVDHKRIFTTTFESLIISKDKHEWDRLMNFLKIEPHPHLSVPHSNPTGKPKYPWVNKIIVQENWLKRALRTKNLPLPVRSKLGRWLIKLNTVQASKQDSKKLKNHFYQKFEDELEALWKLTNIDYRDKTNFTANTVIE